MTEELWKPPGPSIKEEVKWPSQPWSEPGRQQWELRDDLHRLPMLRAQDPSLLLPFPGLVRYTSA